MSPGPLAWVGDTGDGESFSAHVEYDESEGPFSFMQGPNWAEAGVAVGWARQHAPRVVVRVGSEFFSAGEEPYRDAPAWPGPYSAPGVVGAGEEGPVRSWFVQGRTAWFRDDTLEVAERLAEAVRSASEASEVSFGRTEAGFRVRFVVAGPSELDANERASRVLRTAWAATGIETGADDFDMCSIDVREGRRPPANDIDCPALW